MVKRKKSEPRRYRKRYKLRSKGYSRALQRSLRPLTFTNVSLGLPKKLKLRMPYNTILSVNPPIGGPDSVVLRMNSLFDPEVAAGGHQPRGFDQIAALYERYYVLRAYVEIMCLNDSTAAIMLFAVIKDGSTALLTINDVEEERYVKHVLVPHQLTDGAYSKGSMCTYVDISKFTGLSAKTSSNVALVTADPSNGVYCHIGAYPADGIANPSTTEINIKIIYEAVFCEPKNPAIS